MGYVTVDILVLGHRIPKHSLQDFFAAHGPKKCHRSDHKCYPYNLEVVSFVLDHILEHQCELRRACDVIKFDVLNPKPQNWASAVDVLKSLNRTLAAVKAFKKLPCCSVRPEAKYKDASVKSLTKHLGALTLDTSPTSEGKLKTPILSIEVEFKKLLKTGKVERGVMFIMD